MEHRAPERIVLLNASCSWTHPASGCSWTPRACANRYPRRVNRY